SEDVAAAHERLEGSRDGVASHRAVLFKPSDGTAAQSLLPDHLFKQAIEYDDGRAREADVAPNCGPCVIPYLVPARRPILCVTRHGLDGGDHGVERASISWRLVGGLPRPASRSRRAWR